jgi:hypothetical protein
MSSVEVSEENALEGIENTSEDKIGLAGASSRESPTSEKEHLHFVPRSDELPEYDDSQEAESITGYNAALMRARVTLSSGEEKKLIRRIDWHLIPLLSIMYMLKSIDAVNVCMFTVPISRCLYMILQVSNALIMDRGTSRNILTELHMSKNQYNLVTTMYYVRGMEPNSSES